MKRIPTIFSALALVFAVTQAAPAQGIALAHYFTFDNATPEVLAQGATYAPVSPERVWNISQIVSYAPQTMDGPELSATSPVANSPEGGNILICESTVADEGLWVEMTSGFPVGDMTVEVMFYTTDPNYPQTINGTSYNIQCVLSCEVPFGQLFQGQLRIEGDGALNGNPQNGQLAWNCGQPGAGEVSVLSAAPLVANTWYHAVGVLDYNDADPANSEIRLYLSQPPATPTLQGTAIYNAAGGGGLSVGWAPPFDPTQGPNADPGVSRYMIGCSANNSINGSDHRGLSGGIDAVAVTAQAGEIYLPNQPPIPPITGVSDFELYR
jgi:hypothetical protein